MEVMFLVLMVLFSPVILLGGMVAVVVAMFAIGFTGGAQLLSRISAGVLEYGK